MLDLEPIKARLAAVKLVRWREGSWELNRLFPDEQRFVAHARTDIDALLAEVDRLRAELRPYRCDPGTHKWKFYPSSTAGGMYPTDHVTVCTECGYEHQGEEATE